MSFFIKQTRLDVHGHASICIRISIDREQISFSTNFRITPELWDKKRQKVKGRNIIAYNINESLLAIEKNLIEIYCKLQKKNIVIRPFQLRDILLGREQIDGQQTLLFIFDQIVSQKIKLVENGSIKKQSMESYLCTRNKLTDYLVKHYKETDIPIRNLDYKFIANFEVYLLSSCAHNTMIGYMRHLKQVTTYAFNCNYIVSDPFYNKRLGMKNSQRIYLTEEELKIIISHKFEDKKLSKTRDVFVFCCLTGLAYIDLEALTYDQLESNHILGKRQKTKAEFIIPLLPLPLEIIKKYKNIRRKGRKIFPVATCQQINRCLKEIARICGIKKNISTHTARHTCATLLLTKGVPIESVSKILGHTDIKTTQIYAKILKQKITEDVEKVANRFIMPELG